MSSKNQERARVTEEHRKLSRKFADANMLDWADYECEALAQSLADREATVAAEALREGADQATDHVAIGGCGTCALCKAVAVRAAEARLELQAEGTLSERIRAMMRKRDWSLHWIHRSAYLHLEAAELAEAVRGKHGDTLEESADVLITFLALSPHELSEIIPVAERKVMELAAKPPRSILGETGNFGDIPAKRAEQALKGLQERA